MLLFALLFWQAAQNPPPPSYRITEAERERIAARTEALGERMAALRASGRDAALLADVEIFHKAGVWMLRHPEEFYRQEYVDYALRALEKGMARAAELEAGRPSWPSRKGRLIRAYRSRVDASVQPYGLFIPGSYEPGRPMRLDVILHGRNATLTEASFIAAHEDGKQATAPSEHLELHVFGRTNNAYRWSGETDVFEALASAGSRYTVDPARTVLRGFSMGGAGAWHLGLHHPDRWAAVEAGAGFTETRRYARLGEIPGYQERTLRIYDAVEYARNAWNVPVVGYGGDEDPQLQASVNIREKLAAEGLALADLRSLFLVGPGTGHRWHPESKRESDRFLDAILAKPRPVPDQVRFLTFTTRYNRCFWIAVEGLERHYERAEVMASRDSGKVLLRTVNVSRLAVDAPGPVDRPGGLSHVEVDGQAMPAGTRVLEKRGGRWRPGPTGSVRKRHGLQGPIDDAFLDSFLCVRPEGGSPALDRLAREYAKWLRGDVRIKDASAVTEADIENHHLVLFGDPASNRLIARVASRLPIRWDRESIRAGRRRFPAKGHTLVLIAPNPLNPERYVVLNSGHTFGERDFGGTNALLYPRLGDYAILDAEGRVVRAGLFDDDWRLPAEDR